MIIDTTKTKTEREIEAYSLQTEYFRTCKLVIEIQKHLDKSSVRQSFFSEHVDDYNKSVMYERDLPSRSAYYYKGKVIRIVNGGNRISPQRHENSVIYSFTDTIPSLIASQIAQKLIEQEWDIMCQLLMACASKEAIGHPFGSTEFCQSSFRKFADKNAHMDFQPLINPKDAHKLLALNHYIECESVPFGSIFLLPPFDELGAIATTLGVTATQSGKLDGVFWTEAAYCIIYGEQAGWFSN